MDEAHRPALIQENGLPQTNASRPGELPAAQGEAFGALLVDDAALGLEDINGGSGDGAGQLDVLPP